LARSFEQEGKTVFFLEHNVDKSPTDRKNRFYQAYQAQGGGGSLILPLIMADSGYQIESGSQSDFVRNYRNMVDRALARPAQADIQAAFQVTGNNVNVQANITNLSQVPLSRVYNATVHVMIVEERKVLKTSRFVQFHQDKTWGDETAPGESKLFQFTFSNVRLSWNRAFIVVVVDWMPPGQNFFDTMQSTLAVEGQMPTPTLEPTEVPPTEVPTDVPTEVPTDVPTEVPTEAPTIEPTVEKPDFYAYLPALMNGFDLERPEPPEEQ
jgi:hypothetical protein